MPRSVGLPKPWNFLCLKKRNLIEYVEEEETNRTDFAPNFEDVPASLKPTLALRLRGLSKQYKNGK